MNSTMESNNARKAKLSIGDYEFGMGLSFGTILVLVIITYASGKYRRIRAARRNSIATATTSTSNNESTTSTTTIPKGLDEATLLSYPKLPYSEIKLKIGDSITSGCSICLADYKGDDVLRLLPYCGHLFHVKCIDTWLKIHTTCPICRGSGTPLTALYN